MEPLYVYIVGNGLAARNHRAAFEELGGYFVETDDEQKADIIDLCTPPAQHYQQAVGAGNRNKIVVVEKPTFLSMAQAIAVAQNDMSWLVPISQYAYIDPPSSDLELAINYKRDPAYYAEKHWRGCWGCSGGGALLTHGWHVLESLFQAIWDEPGLVSVRCDLMTLWHDIPTEDFASIEFTLDNGDTYIRKVATAPMDLDGFHPPSVLGDSQQGLINQFEDIYHSYRKQVPVKYCFGNAVWMITVLTACYYSHFTQRPVKVDDLIENPYNHPFFLGWQSPLRQQSLQPESSH